METTKFGGRPLGLSAITNKRLVICEGMHDVELFDNLCSLHSLEFQAVSAGYVGGAPRNRDGIDYLTPALNALPGIPGFDTVLEAILIVADNDTTPVDAFNKVKQLIEATADIDVGRRYSVPNQPLVKAGARPSITIMMLPWTGSPGALDTICLTAASNRRSDLAKEVDAFAIAAKVGAAHGWPITKEHKMKLRCLISAAYPKDPNIAPAWVWRDGTDLVPLADPAFKQIVSFLRTFP